MYGCQQVLLKPDPKTKAILEYVCFESNKVYNCGLYYARQVFFKAKRYITKFELDRQLKSNRHFKALRANAAQQTLRSVYEGMKSFKALLKAYYEGKLEDKPRPPKYRKKGFYQVAYPSRYIKLEGDQIKLSLGKQTKAWFGIEYFYLPMPSNLDFKEIKELRIIPRNRCFYLELVYQREDSSTSLNQNNVLGIDHGLNNWLTGVSTVGTSFIIDGKQLKSMNNWYNKQLATIKENKPQGFWSNKLAKITEKRNRQMRDAINKAARLMINHCLDNDIGTIVFGWNKGQKSGADMGKKTNQKFVSIPTARLKARLEDLAVEHNICFMETEESYTSIASFLDGDHLPQYGEKPNEWKPSGKRVKRGLYRTGSNQYINADCNGAANIIRKVTTSSSILRNVSLERVSMGSLTAPQRFKIWSAKKTLRNGNLFHCVASA